MALSQPDTAGEPGWVMAGVCAAGDVLVESKVGAGHQRFWPLIRRFWAAQPWFFLGNRPFGRKSRSFGGAKLPFGGAIRRFGGMKLWFGGTILRFGGTKPWFGGVIPWIGPANRQFGRAKLWNFPVKPRFGAAQR